MFAERGYVWNEGNLAGGRTRADSAPRLPTPTRLTVRVMFEVRVSVRVKAMGKVNTFLASRPPVRGKLRASVFILQTLFSFYRFCFRFYKLCFRFYRLCFHSTNFVVFFFTDSVFIFAKK